MWYRVHNEPLSGKTPLGLGFFNVASDKEFGGKNRFVVWPQLIIVPTCICDHDPSFMRTIRKAWFTHLKKAG
jgi:hypothetical protein